MLVVKIKADKERRKKAVEKLALIGTIVEGSDETDLFITKNSPEEKEIEMSFSFSFDIDDEKAYEAIEYLSKLMGDN